MKKALGNWESGKIKWFYWHRARVEWTIKAQYKRERKEAAGQFSYDSKDLPDTPLAAEIEQWERGVSEKQRRPWKMAEKQSAFAKVRMLRDPCHGVLVTGSMFSQVSNSSAFSVR